MELGTVKSREKLKPQREPYWQKLAVGQHLGFRPSSAGGGGTWIARFYDPDTGKKPLQSLGAFDHLPASERFTAASKAAREWFKHLSSGGAHETITVRQACERYAEHLSRDKGEVKADEARARFRRFIDADPIASIDLPKLKKVHLLEWRHRLTAAPAVIANRKGSKPTRKRSPATINRDMVPVRAALNLALADGHALSALAWRAALKPLEANGRRTLYLDRPQRRALLDKLPQDVATFITALCLLPIRPGALAGLCVRDFDARQKTLRIHHDKAGGGRTILLPDATAKHLRASARGKLPTAPLFARWDGKAWDKEMWKKPIKEAMRAAELPESASAYTLRHSVITDLVTEGLDLFTVAQISGTSVAMIEKHYGHLQRDRAAKALAGLSL